MRHRDTGVLPFFFQAEDGIRDKLVTGVQTCALPIWRGVGLGADAEIFLIRSLYQKNLSVRTKADASPVTEADVRAEELIRAILGERFPGHGFYGEETGRRAMDAESVWLVDPLDGTKSFVRECPFFSTQIALRRAGRLVLGVSCAPAYGELAWAEQGSGAYLNDRPIRVSGVAELAGAIVSTGNL